MKKCYDYPEYGINIISVNWVINNIVESEIIKFCCSHNLQIRQNSRDIKRLIGHFLATTLLAICKDHVTMRNILNLSPISLQLIETDGMSDVFDKCMHQFLSKFKFCHVAYTDSLDQLNIDQLYHLKSLADTCHIKLKNLEKLKKYLSSNHFTKLNKDIHTDLVLQQLLC